MNNQVLKLDCSRFHSDKELADAIASSGASAIVLEGCPDNAHYRKMNAPNPGQVFHIGDIVKLSKDLLESLGMGDTNETGVVVGVELGGKSDDWFYKVRHDDGFNGLYQWYELDLVKSKDELVRDAMLR